MKPFVLALICVFAYIEAFAAADSDSVAWRNFKRQHGKVNEGQEEAIGLANFLASKRIIERHNANSSSTYKMGFNHMSDWSREEFAQINGFKPGFFGKRSLTDARSSDKLDGLLKGPVPEEVDWRKVANRVTAVKDQGNCGGCWAFSTVGLLEGQLTVRNSSKFVSLSAQQLLDCSEQNAGCHGGFTAAALEDIGTDMGGIESEQDYPYEETNRECRMDDSKFVINVREAYVLPQDDEEKLKKVVANYGPVAVALDATEYLKHYDSGVFVDSTCSSETNNHAVLLVGYGRDPEAGDYWIVKNSWSAKWGEQGYFKIKRGVNMCAIAQYASIALF